MKNGCVFLMLILILLSCKYSSTDQNHENSYTCKTYDTLIFHTNLSGLNGKLCGVFRSKKIGQSFIYFGNPFQEIDVFNSKGKFLFLVDLKKFNHIKGTIESVQFVSLDSILLFTAPTNFIYLINKEGKILKKIILPYSSTKNYSIFYYPSSGQIFVDHRKIYATPKPVENGDLNKTETLLSSQRKYTKYYRNLTYLQSFRYIYTDSIRKDISLPIHWSNFVPPSTFFIPFNKFFITTNDEVIITNVNSDSLFLYKIKDFSLIKRIAVTSKYNNHIGVGTPFLDSTFVYSNSETQQKQFRTEAFISKVLYNPTDSLYHLLIIDSSDNRTTKMNYSIISLDRKLNKVNEIQFDGKIFGPNFYCFNNDVWLEYKKPDDNLNQIENQTIEFIRLKYEKK